MDSIVAGPAFEAFPKIPRLSREIVITEKIDGTNAQVWISEDGTTMKVGSRNRWLSLESDNFGFCKWAEENREELFKLGPGRHFGEWWGLGIQRGYGLNEKRFSLFNVGRWTAENLPACCRVVPKLYEGPFDQKEVDVIVAHLAYDGSNAAPGFMTPEGIVIYHTASKQLFKKTLVDDEKPKGEH
jgi:hypothetical protein